MSCASVGLRRVAWAIALLLLASVAHAEVAPVNPKTVELVPAVHRGHSVAWKVGAIVTFTSMGLTLLGAALVATSIHGERDWDYPRFYAGFMISIAGDGGVAIGGPVTWLAGIGRRAE